MFRTGSDFEWAIGDEDEQSQGPEDHAWSAVYQIPSQPLRVPSLQWVSDFSESDLMAYRLALAMRQPLGRA